jgi:hypothetical protein
MLSVQTLMDIGAAGRGGAEGIAARQRQRLTSLLDAARDGAFYRAALHGRPSAHGRSPSCR